MTPSAEEVADFLRQIAAGTCSLSIIGGLTWDESAGNVSFRAGEHTVTFFRDAGDLDYLDSIALADQRRGEFEDWIVDDNVINPVDLLSRQEARELEQRLSVAPPSEP